MSDNLEREIEKGSRAEGLLKNEVYRDAVGKVRQGIHDAWAASPVRDVEGQTNLRLMLKLLDDLEKNIKSVANTGKLALAQKERDLSLAEQARKAAAGLISRFT